MNRRMSLLGLILLCICACSTQTTETRVTATLTVPVQTTVPTTSTAIASPTPSSTTALETAGDGVVNGWAVLADKNDYSDVDMTDLPVDFINLERMRQVLLDARWQKDQILELLEFDQSSLQEALKWLSEHADEDDLIFVYISSHGLYLHQNIHWGDFFPRDWGRIQSQKRVLVLDTCHAGAFTVALKHDPDPYLSIGSVGKDEYGWVGLEEEGLPIIGGVFTYYFTAAFTDPEADNDGDGVISVQEATYYAEDHQRTYMHEVVFEVPEFLEMFNAAGSPKRDPDYPHVIMDDTIGSPVILSSIVH